MLADLFLGRMILLLVLLLANGCTRPQPHKPPVCLRVHLDMPDMFGVHVAVHFRTIPDSWRCKGVSTLDGKFKPLRNGVQFTVPRGQSIFDVPLKWQEKDYCRYQFHYATIELTDTANAARVYDLIQVFRDLPRSLSKELLPDTVYIDCGPCDRLYDSPPVASFCCLKHDQQNEYESIFYYLSGAYPDTVAVTICVKRLDSTTDAKDSGG